MLKITIKVDGLKGDVSVEGNGEVADCLTVYHSLMILMQDIKDKVIDVCMDRAKCNKEEAEKQFNEVLEKTMAIKHW